jgi:serine/threonine-protein kinase
VTASAPLLRDLSGRRLGRYEVLVQLASGGMATVYVARAQGVAGFERLVAIKVLHPHLAHDEEFISMFLDEARLAARIRHPNVVPTLDISDTQGDGYFLVMEYVEGDHLGSILREASRSSTPVPMPVVARVLIDALEGLGAAHGLADGDGKALGIVHRDVSPHNVLVGVDGIARITDFGVAKATVRLSSTRDGQFKGKLSYMAPEQASEGSADQRSDLFSMGIVLWESLTGRRLFRAENNGELLNKLLHEPIPLPSQHAPASKPFDEVCAKALARKPADRFQSAEEFALAIETAAAGAGGVASPRAVGKLVKELLGAKVEQMKTRIRGAIDSLGRSELKAGLLPLPEAGHSQPSQPQRPTPSSMTPSAVRTIPTDDMTMGAKPSTVTTELETRRPRRGPWIALAIGASVLLALAAIGVVMLSHGEAPAAAAPSPVPVPVPLPVPVPAPEAEQPPETAGAVAEPAAEPTDDPEVAPTPAEDPEAVDETEPRESSRRHRRRRSRGAGESEDDEDLIRNPYRH